MKRPVNKIICAALSSVVALSALSFAACSKTYGGEKLDGDISSAAAAVSNGGFAVEKGNYVYFINGVESNTALNDFGKPLKGTVQRISVSDLNAGNYSSTQTVVPQIAYTTSYSSGLFIYGDYIYYATPSTARNSDGSVLNSNLELKRTKLDGTETKKDAYVTFPSTAYDYRFVEMGDVVYLMYAATSETLYGETTGVTNLHSVNTQTGEDTLLAYNVAAYAFDAEDKTNPRVYYTMNVVNYAGTSNTNYGYNQIYSVTADVTSQNEYDVSGIIGWDDETDRYINCGALVFDGIGGKNAVKTPFNFHPDKAEEVNDLNFTYTIETYRNNTLFYTRHTSSNSAEYLFSLKDGAVASGWNPVTANPAQSGNEQILNNGSSADGYLYLFDGGDLSAVIAAESSGGISINKVKDGKLAPKINEENKENYYMLVPEGTATLLFTDGDYLYYSLSGGNGYTFYRVDYTGARSDYEGMPETDEVSEFTSVKILDLDAASDWFMPEIIENHLLFAGETDSMTTYNYIMAYDLAGQTNAQISAQNDMYEGLTGENGLFASFDDTSKYPASTYQHLSGALKYLFYTPDKEYIEELAAAHLQAQIDAATAEAEEGEEEIDLPDPVYSETTLKKLDEFLAPSADNDWADYTATKNVNGQKIAANRRDYYYSVLGRMTETDAENYRSDLRSSNLQAWPEETPAESWWSTLNTVSKVFFIIGMCVAGLLVIGGAAALIIVLVRKKRTPKMPQYSKRRIKVDTTDDKDIDVYGDGTSPDGGDKKD